MNQAALDLHPLTAPQLPLPLPLALSQPTQSAGLPSVPASATVPAAPGADDGTGRAGFQIGWDHAHHGLVPPAELLLNGSPVCQGWLAGKAVFGRRVLGNTRHTRAWLALRITAWRQGIDFDDVQVTPHYLAQIAATQCPVLRTPLGGASGAPDAAVIDRINPLGAYAAGNLVVISQRAASARQGVDVLEALRRANWQCLHGADGASNDRTESTSLGADAWRRLAALRAFATPLPFHDAARLPLVLLPPNRVRVLNAAQGLQALLTLPFAAPGWAARTRAIGALLPAHSLRQDFNLFIGALAPRVLEATGHHGVGKITPAALRHLLEDAWRNERVQRRWQHLVLSLGDAATAALLERATALNLAGVRTMCHAPAQAVEGWGLVPGVAAMTVAGAPCAPRADPLAQRAQPQLPTRQAAPGQAH